ncbi:MAG: hypothetical protein QOJ92_2219 [Frankiales bacterium]|nr:hypothetical protein [Frankiales bacterium]
MDDELVDRLRTTQGDAPPEDLLAAAKAAYLWRTTGSICPPSYDSLLDEGLAAVRGEQDSRLLSFTADALAVDLEISGQGAVRTLVGQLTPGEAANVTIRHGGAHELVVASDSLGRFEVGGLTGGPLSLRCELASGGGLLHTEWVLV